MTRPVRAWTKIASFETASLTVKLLVEDLDPYMDFCPRWFVEQTNCLGRTTMLIQMEDEDMARHAFHCAIDSILDAMH